MSDYAFDLRDLMTFSAVSPLDILREQNPDAVPADAPPAAANYRTVDMQGIGCAGCAKFVLTNFDGEGEAAVATGYCSQWEALVRGDWVCDNFADPGPSMNDDGEEQWDFAEKREIAEVYLAGAPTREEDGYVIKEILRTGEWPVIPTRGGIVEKQLRVIRDGASNKDEGIISLSELLENFKSTGIRPQIPLSDEEGDDHKNTTKLNQGFVEDLWITDGNDGSRLVAKMNFTEPETKEKVLRGTYADVSCGIPWQIVSRGQKHGTVVEHVAITNRPFIDGLGPFMAASDQMKDHEIEVVHFGLPTVLDEETGTEQNFSARQIMESAQQALATQLALAGYEVRDVTNDDLTIASTVADMTWTVKYTIQDGAVVLAEVKDWTVNEAEGTSDAPAEQMPAAPPQDPEMDALEAAQRLRQIRLPESSIPATKEAKMPLTREELDRLDLSDEQRAAFQSVLNENAQLSATSREAEVATRITELEGLGLKDWPGFLKLYRDVALSDDGGPAIVLLSDNGQEKTRKTAKGLLDDAIAALVGEDGKVHLSDQALVSGNDDKPPETPENGDKRPVEERVDEMRETLYGKS